MGDFWAELGHRHTCSDQRTDGGIGDLPTADACSSKEAHHDSAPDKSAGLVIGRWRAVPLSCRGHGRTPAGARAPPPSLVGVVRADSVLIVGAGHRSGQSVPLSGPEGSSLGETATSPASATAAKRRSS